VQMHSTAVQGLPHLGTPPEGQGNAPSSLLGLSPLPRDESISIESVPNTLLKSIHMRKEKPEFFPESIATKEGLPCAVVQLQPDTKARACA
jgi:hypothetical protein